MKLNAMRDKRRRANEQKRQNKMEQTSMRTITEYLALK